MENNIAHVVDTIIASHKNIRTDTSPQNKCPIDIFLVDKTNSSEVKTLWTFLEKQIQSAGLTCSWDWIETWLTHYQDLVDYWFCIGIHNNTICGITLITQETRRPLPIPVKGFHIGTNGEPFKDQVRAIHNTILAKKDLSTLFCVSVVEYITTHFHTDEITFNDYDALQMKKLETVLQEKNTRIVQDVQICRYFDLQKARNSNTDILSLLSNETRYTIKRSLKAFNNDITTEWAETKEQAIDILEELIKLYQKHWTKEGKKGMFASERFTAFQRDIVLKLFDKRSIILFRVKSKQYGTLGCLYLLVDEKTGWGYQAGFNDFADVEFSTINKKRLRVGFIVHTLCMQECTNRGLDKYNFGVGEYQYKRELTNEQSEIITVSIRKNLKPLIRDTIMRLYLKIDASKTGSLLLKPVRSFL